jgi:hypothetical protein
VPFGREGRTVPVLVKTNGGYQQVRLFCMAAAEMESHG